MLSEDFYFENIIVSILVSSLLEGAALIFFEDLTVRIMGIIMLLFLKNENL